MISQDSGRILALESMLEEARASLMAHDILLRGLLAHLALNDPGALGGLIEAVAKSPAALMPPPVEREVRAILDDITEAMPRG
jgi:hypothetical protein